MTKHVKLTFRRQPDEDGGSSIVLLQQAAGFEEMAGVSTTDSPVGEMGIWATVPSEF